MKYIFSILLLLTLISCYINKNINDQIFGKYQTNFDGLFGEIILKKDYTFEYQYHAGLINTKSKGVWKMSNNEVVLNSYKDYLNNAIEVKEGLDKGEIIISDSYGSPILGAFVVLDNNEIFETNQNGKISFYQNRDFKYFEVHYLGETYRYDIKNKETNSYQVTIYLDDLSKTYFKSQKFKFKNNTISDNKLYKYFKVVSQ
ncbi:hypothetical protein [Flavobacterium okayamense]|uniref:Lipoprotein n=1 Tax=Flavobacterium okayamense TaxID=2830782 RepID=A0ABM7S4S1_9FLAO|nr:hypothetical protein [Flavobacterium okayamense]BCY28079.1 hypothetical protein KK2020170_09470 [Flavobacterium okayamense]